jgi:hypothetical protein
VAGNQAPSAKELKLIIEAAGGTLLQPLDSSDGDFDPSQTVILQSSLTCLFFAEVNSKLTVIENGDEFDIHLRSEASVFWLLPSSLVANATLDPDSLEDSVIHNLAISLAAGFVTINGSYNNGIIRGNIEIPLLACSGQVDLRVSNQDASFTASITLYNGALNVNVAAEWDWKLSYFRGSMGNFVTGPFHISSVKFEANSNDDMVYFKADASIPLLGCSSSVEFQSNSINATFDSALGLFGGVVEINASAEWKWDGSYYVISFTETNIGFLGIIESTVEFYSDQSASAELEISAFGVISRVTAQFDEHGIDLIGEISGPNSLRISGKVIFSGPELQNYNFPTSQLLEPVAQITPMRAAPIIKQVKLQQTTGEYLNIFELEIFNPTGTNVARGKSATSSSEYEDP